ncbi:MAG: hydroxymethylpyrimidine/phosphomethylpyrimidine kinase [Vicinamibacterales bacterium]
MRTALTIAGSDSSGGAGIQADLKTFAAHGVYGASVITAVTAQNTLGVTAVHVVPSAMVRAQIDAVISDLGADAIKIGMLATADIVRTVAEAIDAHLLRAEAIAAHIVRGEAIAAHALRPVVLDPVMVAKGGSRLLAADAVEAVRSLLLARCAIVTPNLAEAEVLTNTTVRDVPAMEQAARALVDAGAGAALIKGGHLDDDRVVDVLWTGDERHVFEGPRIDTRHTHGTGCTLSSAIAARLALGEPLAAAVTLAIDYVREAIAHAPGLGKGHGPLNHFPKSSQ